MSKERALRREQRAAEQEQARLVRERRDRRRRRVAKVRHTVLAPVRWASTRGQLVGRRWGRWRRGQRLVAVIAPVALVVGLVAADAWGGRILVFGLWVLLLPVVWTLVSGRR